MLVYYQGSSRSNQGHIDIKIASAQTMRQQRAASLHVTTWTDVNQGGSIIISHLLLVIIIFIQCYLFDISF